MGFGFPPESRHATPKGRRAGLIELTDRIATASETPKGRRVESDPHQSFRPLFRFQGAQGAFTRLDADNLVRLVLRCGGTEWAAEAKKRLANMNN